MGEERIHTKFVENFEGIRSLRRHGHGRQVNIVLGFEERGLEIVDWIYLSFDSRSGGSF
jgi:hypothetical protein